MLFILFPIINTSCSVSVRNTEDIEQIEQMKKELNKWYYNHNSDCPCLKKDSIK